MTCADSTGLNSFRMSRENARTPDVEHQMRSSSSLNRELQKPAWYVFPEEAPNHQSDLCVAAFLCLLRVWSRLVTNQRTMNERT